MKKILFGFFVALIAVAALPLFAAFEAHVINVTAKIENALSVPIDPINFGTVFPQEQLERELSFGFSQSFQAEPDADDVEYIIRQKPKCGVTSENGTVLNGPTWTGHVVPTVDDPATEQVDESNGGTAYTIDCEVDKPKDLVLGTGQTAGLLPSLCEYISKHPDNQPENDESLNSFHKAFSVVNGIVDWNDVAGALEKGNESTDPTQWVDAEDTWIIDLAVPCFGNHCAQDWSDFVKRVSGNQDINPNDYVQPLENEHKIFGCNLWVEVTGVSRFSDPDEAP
jgi:hypothetical protein